MKSTLTTTQGFHPFTFTVTVETKEEAEVIRTLYTESQVLARYLDSRNSLPMPIHCINEILEGLGCHAYNALLR